MDQHHSVLMVIMVLHTGFSAALVTVAGGVMPSATMPFEINPHTIPMLLTFIISVCVELPIARALFVCSHL